VILTREQKEQVVLDYLCYGQVGEYVYGEDECNSTEIQWSSSREEWQIITNENGKTYIDYESGECTRAVAELSDAILDNMIGELYSDEELEEMVERAAE
jgi:hypothetical protein